MGDTQVDAPAMSEEEKALLKAQAEILTQAKDLLSAQTERQTLLDTLFFQTSGITEKKDEAGKVIGYEFTPGGTVDLQNQINKAYLERTQAALKGELPVDPALLRQLGESEQTLREGLSRQLGPGYETSTPGARTLAEFGQRKTEILEGARRGDLTLAQTLALQGQGGAQGGLGFAASGTIGASEVLAQSLGNLAGQYGQATQPYQYQQGLQLRADESNAQFMRDIVSGAIKGGAFVAGSKIGCWIAQAIYGDAAVEVPLIRDYLRSRRRINLLARLGSLLYGVFGQRVAACLPHNRLIRYVATWYFAKLRTRALTALS